MLPSRHGRTPNRSSSGQDASMHSPFRRGTMDDRSQHGYQFAPAHSTPWATAPDPRYGYVDQGPQTHVAIAHPEPPQAWAFQTPHGLQLVQPGTVAAMAPTPVEGRHSHRMRRRVRWETIVPMVAVLCLVASIGFFIHDFDRITGRDTNQESAASSTASLDEQSTLPANGQQPANGGWNTNAPAATAPAATKAQPARVNRTRTAGTRARSRANAATKAAARPSATAPNRGAPAPPGAATAGGSPPAGGAAPPTSSPQAAAPQRPSIPNATGASGGGSGTGAIGAAPTNTAASNASSAGKGTGASCTWMVMDGVSTCM